MVLAALYFAVALFWFYLAWKGPSPKIKDFELRTHFKIWYGWEITDALPAVPSGQVDSVFSVLRSDYSRCLRPITSF